MKVQVGSDNIFADLGLPHPEEHLAKAELALRIGEAIRQQRLAQTAAAELLGIDQPKISRLLRGYLTNFSDERLMHFLTLLGRDVEITDLPLDFRTAAKLREWLPGWRERCGSRGSQTNRWWGIIRAADREPVAEVAVPSRMWWKS